MRVDVSGSEPLGLVRWGPDVVGNRLLFESVSRDPKSVENRSKRSKRSIGPKEENPGNEGVATVLSTLQPDD